MCGLSPSKYKIFTVVFSPQATTVNRKLAWCWETSSLWNLLWSTNHLPHMSWASDPICHQRQCLNDKWRKDTKFNSLPAASEAGCISANAWETKNICNEKGLLASSPWLSVTGSAFITFQYMTKIGLKKHLGTVQPSIHNLKTDVMFLNRVTPFKAHGFQLT